MKAVLKKRRLRNSLEALRGDRIAIGTALPSDAILGVVEDRVQATAAQCHEYSFYETLKTDTR